MTKSKSHQAISNETITTAQAAEMAGVHPKTIADWVKRGYLRARRKGFGPGSPLLIYRDSFERLMQAREITPKQ